MAPVPDKTKEVNLLPQGEFEKSTAGRILKWILTTFRGLVIIVELIVIAGFLARFYLDVRHTDLNDEIEEKEEIIKSQSQFESEFRLTQERLNIFKEASSEKNNFLPLLEGITQSLPGDTKLKSITKKSGLVELTGASLSETSIEQFIVNLQSKFQTKDIAVTSIESKSTSPFTTFILQINYQGLESTEKGST